jgi:Ca2+-binding EF-hand superfamily protein
VKKIWQQYGSEGNGYIEREEVKHYLTQIVSNYKGSSIIPEAYFNEWFNKIDKDGDGKIDMI